MKLNLEQAARVCGIEATPVNFGTPSKPAYTTRLGNVVFITHGDADMPPPLVNIGARREDATIRVNANALLALATVKQNTNAKKGN